MKTAFIIFNRMPMLGFISGYDPLMHLKPMGFMPEFIWDICAASKDVINDENLPQNA